ncbi:FecR family protein [Pseudomonas flavescens]|uniref:FecR family protein n=1 Tax=Phytopseudomonas flavescens TaxID=29435 RepID=A0A1G8KU36_9GAMM|nr:DUF4880 domain-containing protein [Pseudomonas flavescens]SDI46926.1 FecR family protein [Pseudomonas flavescens]
MSDEQRIRREAAHWIATLQSGEVDVQVQADFLRWQSADPRHADTIERLYRRLRGLRHSPLQQVDEEHLAATLAAPSRRRFLHGALAIGGLGLGALLLGRLGSTGLAWPGDLYTGIGERKRFTLADGSALTLNASSRVSTGARSLRLQQGELILEVASAADGPFTIGTNNCLVSSGRNRLLVRQEPGASYILAQQEELLVNASGGQRHTLAAGQWLRLSHDGVVHGGPARGTESLWLQGLMDVDNRPLGEVIERLRPYHRGVLQLAPELAALRVSGVFPLDDSRHALDMLALALPVRLVAHTSLWIAIQPA